MKRYLSLVLALSMLLAISACGGPVDDPTTVPTTIPITEPTAEPTTVPITEPPTTEPPTTEPPTTEPPTTEPPTTEPPTTEPPTTEPPTTEPPTTEPPTTEPPTTEPPTTEPPATEPPTTEPPATEPPATEPPATEPPTTEPPATEPVDYAELTKKYSGRWYLQGYSDIYIDVSRFGSDEAMSIEATGISLSGDVATDDSYVLYPALIDGYTGYHGTEIPFSAWDEWLSNKRISLNGTSITLGNRIFVRDAGTKDKYTGSFCREALGTWYLDKDPDVRIEIEVVGGNEDSGDYYGISTVNLDLVTLEHSKNDYETITAAKNSDWTNLGISVSNNTLTIVNAYGTKVFYREPTYPTEPPSTEPPSTEPPSTEPPTTEPPVTEPPVTEPPTTEPPTTEPPTTEPPTTEPPATEPTSNVLIISDSRTISDQTIDTDVYITYAGTVTFNNVTVNGNIYCYGQLKCSGCTANNVYAYAYGSMMSCGAFDGTHGKVSGGLSCNNMVIQDDALDYAFAMWGKF